MRGYANNMALPDDYLVNLDVFRGPLDLLLYLVKRDEVDIRDIPIARVAEQFKDYLTLVQIIDVERAGDFLVMSATLMEIKSRMLLPRPEETASEEEDPRRELVRQLLEYKRFKEAGTLLEARAEAQSRSLPRQPPPPPTSAALPALRPVELWDLVSAFGRLMRETLALEPQQIVLDYTPIHIYMEQILQRLDQEGPLKFSQLFTPPYNRGRLVGLFLAILELAKSRQISAEQTDTFGDILVARQPENPLPIAESPETETPPP
jgi:segregation and condensation protein A